MISVEKATQLVLQDLPDWGMESVSLEAAVGRVSAENITADRDFPPFTRVSMDGIAIRFQAFAGGLRRFPIAGIQTAGSPPLTLEDPSQCLEVMTGSVLPLGTDTVIRYEDLTIEAGTATINIDTVQAGQNAHHQGLDQQAGSTIVPVGNILGAAEIGIAATVGKSELLVKKNPRVLLISTGDELVEVDETPLPHQIRKSNVYALQAALKMQGIPAEHLHLSDEREAIASALQRALKQHDVLILSGGVSKGKLDFIPEVLEELDVQKAFHLVQQRPGKPFWFGRKAAGAFVFALPGNPVSTFMCLHRYFFPWWRAALGIPALDQQAVLTEEFSFKPTLTYFLQVRIQQDPKGCWLATPVTGKGSGDLANLVQADGFLELPATETTFSAGSLFPVWTYRYL